MKITTNTKGQLAVSKAELRAFELGFLPSRPLYDARYDLIIDNGKRLLRVQVKYADGRSTNSGGSVIVKLEYEDRQKNVYTHNNSEVDVLVVYIPCINKLCYFPKEVFIGKRKISIRINNAKNNQKRRVITAEDYYW